LVQERAPSGNSNVLEIAVDAERGILLQRRAFAGDTLQQRIEVVKFAFDEEFAPETFVWTPSADRPVQATNRLLRMSEGGP
jgi:outer membrane lipoprotein-sorting protein